MNIEGGEVKKRWKEGKIDWNGKDMVSFNQMEEYPSESTDTSYYMWGGPTCLRCIAFLSMPKSLNPHTTSDDPNPISISTSPIIVLFSFFLPLIEIRL